MEASYSFHWSTQLVWEEFISAFGESSDMYGVFFKYSM